MCDYLREHLHKGFIVPSKAPFASPVLFAKKPGGGWRFCVDYCLLNSKTKLDRMPLPLINETLDRLSRARIFTKLDIRQAFHRIRMHPDSEDLTTFRTRYGCFKYRVVPFGLTNGPAAFQRFINNILMDLLDECCTAYIDDIIIYSEDPLMHEIHVQKVMKRLMDAGLYADIKKSEFFVTKTKYLGFIISTDGISVDPEKIAAIVSWKEPNTVKGVQSFLGFCNFYRRFVRNFGQVACPLTNLTRKDTKWHWGRKEQEAFNKLKKALISAPVLAYFNPLANTKVETDASDGVVAGVMSQEGPDGLYHPVAYLSVGMNEHEMRYEIYDKEMLAVVTALREWKSELQSLQKEFLVVTDHKALEYFSTKRELNDRQIRWLDTLSELHFKITYRPGRENHLADALSRKSEDLKTQKALKEASKTATLIKPESIVTTVEIGLNALEVRPYGFELVDLILTANKDLELTAP